MVPIDIFLFIWLGLVCCMCTRLCYEEHRERYPNSTISYSYIKRKLCFCCKEKPLIEESEMTDSHYTQVGKTEEGDPPHWVHP